MHRRDNRAQGADGDIHADHLRPRDDPPLGPWDHPPTADRRVALGTRLSWKGWAAGTLASLLLQAIILWLLLQDRLVFCRRKWRSLFDPAMRRRCETVEPSSSSVLDGVYRTTEGVPVFHTMHAPTATELQALLLRIIKRLMRFLTRKGFLIEERA